MAAGKFKFYEYGREYLGDGTLDMDLTTNMQWALFLSTSNANTLSVGTGVYGDLTNEHANANGYTTGGIAATGETWTHSGAVVTFDCNDPAWTASGGSIIARYCVLYVNATVNTIVKPLIGLYVLDTAPADVAAAAGFALTVEINPGGVFTNGGASTD